MPTTPLLIPFPTSCRVIINDGDDDGDGDDGDDGDDDDGDGDVFTLSTSFGCLL